MDANPLRISLYPCEGLGILDDKVPAEPSEPVLVPHTPSIEVRDDFGAMPKYKQYRLSRRRSRTSSQHYDATFHDIQ
jgi:hypothetical protein